MRISVPTMIWTVPLVSPKHVSRAYECFNMSLSMNVSICLWENVQISSLVSLAFALSKNLVRNAVLPSLQVVRDPYDMSFSLLTAFTERIFEQLADDVVFGCFMLLDARHKIFLCLNMVQGIFMRKTTKRVLTHIGEVFGFYISPMCYWRLNRRPVGIELTRPDQFVIVLCRKSLASE